ncbi:translational GTPase TypA [Candidatus Amarolinea aalborgensis]|jgi:GTP-binding protein|uniref:translational GTPase TypA n=1 Tax=Candidatus Amarolinea aalborgensis TaxID=2249329 RepID=UPI003BF949F7
MPELNLTTRSDIRNVAIIAHVDHGKTTLVDAILKQTRVFRDNQLVIDRVLDSNDLERERGITILAKNMAVYYKGVKINIVDTPGHADFGGEVERVLNMVDGVLLLVDAVDGPMPQTRFVLRKALELGHRAIVVVNKVDRKDSRPEWVTNAIFDLFIDLGATDEQASFPVVYAIGQQGRAGDTPDTLATDLTPLLDLILNYLPGPTVNMGGPAQMLITLLAYDDYKGRIAIGRLFAGRLHRLQQVAVIATSGQARFGRLAQVFSHQGLERVEQEEVEAGDIVAVTGLPEVTVSETVADASDPHPLPPIRIEEPTVRMTFGVNTSPFTGREGTWSTSRKLRERLFKELEHNVSLRVDETDSADTFLVSGRGELHLVVLIETMRREGYEFEVSKPEVIFHTDAATGERLEPIEEAYIEVPEPWLGAVVEMLGTRRAQLQDMRHSDNGIVFLHYKVPTRGLLGFRNDFLTMTKGNGIIHTLFAGYEPFYGPIGTRTHGSLVAWEAGVATTYGLKNAEERGTLFIGPNRDVYEGMIVGQNSRDTDMDVNVCKKKQLTNMRASSSEIQIRLTPHRILSLDDCIEFVSDDEVVEVTPLNIRMRKRILNSDLRRKAAKDKDE